MGELHLKLERVAALGTRGLDLAKTPTLYYGDELGLPDAPVDAWRARDCAELRAPGLRLGRDPQRMPMPWEATPPHAGSRPTASSRGCPYPLGRDGSASRARSSTPARSSASSGSS
ncbi:alpha-amylase family glycosyl hydrolase [Nonomuraea jabiensis]|uniref:alpha-amylase family glycosyl hydrolase n=1 Tax=Nonomuraea jabiensis TaxID=882448 RepID=UPI00406BAD5A